MRRRKNFSAAGNRSSVNGSLRQMYTDWHWGVEPKNLTEINDPDLPEELVETGRLVELHYRQPEQNPKRKDKVYKLAKKNSNKTHLAFDPHHKYERLYIATNDKPTLKKFKKDLYTTSPYKDVDLGDMSLYVGGKHAMDDYPPIDARAVGILTSIVYACEKEGDGYSFYVHKMGEESGIQPILAASKDGRLWVVGGNYTSPIQGITD